MRWISNLRRDYLKRLFTGGQRDSSHWEEAGKYNLIGKNIFSTAGESQAISGNRVVLHFIEGDWAEGWRVNEEWMKSEWRVNGEWRESEWSVNGELRESEWRVNGEWTESERKVNGEWMETERRVNGEWKESEGRVKGEWRESEGRVKGEWRGNEGRKKGTWRESEGRVKREWRESEGRVKGEWRGNEGRVKGEWRESEGRVKRERENMKRARWSRDLSRRREKGRGGDMKRRHRRLKASRWINSALSALASSPIASRRASRLTRIKHGLSPQQMLFNKQERGLFSVRALTGPTFTPPTYQW